MLKTSSQYTEYEYEDRLLDDQYHCKHKWCDPFIEPVFGSFYLSQCENCGEYKEVKEITRSEI